MENYIIRRAELRDLGEILVLLKLVKLPLASVEENLDNFFVAEENRKIVGCVGMENYDDSCLPRSLAVYPNFQNQGIGARLWDRILSHARAEGMKEAVILTETAPEFFARKFGFVQIPRETANEKVKQSVEFREACSESAVCMKLELTV